MGKIEIFPLSTLLSWGSVQIIYHSGLNFSIEVKNGWDYQSRMTLNEVKWIISLEYHLSKIILLKHHLIAKNIF
jgi:hypothetical protein